jgi:MFS family permease
MIIISGTFAQALTGSSGGARIIGVLIVFRFITGVGIGGDYPLSAVITSEFSPNQIRGRLMTSVFAAQGWGNFSAFHYHLNMVHFRINPLCSRCFGSIYHCQCLQKRTS